MWNTLSSSDYINGSDGICLCVMKNDDIINFKYIKFKYIVDQLTSVFVMNSIC